MRWKSLSLFLFLFSDIALSDEVLINGRPAKSGEYEEVIRIRHSGSTCTASAVGPRAMVTAAHCVADNGSISPVREDAEYYFTIAQREFTAKCKQHPRHRDRQENVDIAFCRTNTDLGLKKYANIAGKHRAVKVGDKPILMGYGCVRSNSPRGGNDGILRVGKGTVSALARPEDRYNWFRVDKKGSEESTLCYGDSGGPVFSSMGDAFSEDHWIVGINSQGNIRDMSLLVDVTLDKVRDFMRDFSRDMQVDICGFNINCVEEKPEPEPEPEPRPECRADEWKMLRAKSDMIKATLEYEEANEKYKQCLKGGVIFSELNYRNLKDA